MQERVQDKGRATLWGERWPAVTTRIFLGMGAILCIAAALLT